MRLGPRPIGFDVGDPDRLTPQDDNARGSSGWGLILRILIVVFLGVLFWASGSRLRDAAIAVLD